ncbi:hypothetical protein SI65_09963 [Aspergillus cristatus]|uniref:Aminoglycoside phosphotransferase domain-containing protein n=1 Tax=Aspergillus cristatus TaxID=573508 RepID=A0A1E3B116_ASPCR|nr:hypothetical protein SI65_09963 [Aspergillus cristatus]
MIYVSQHTSIPVPKIYAYVTYGPLERERYCSEPLFDTYIFMEFVEGRNLDGICVGHTNQEKKDICSQLREYVDELQSISTGEEPYIGSVDHGPVMDDVVNWYNNPGPFGSVEEFHNNIIDAFEEMSREGDVRNFLTGMVSQQKYNNVFTHGDLSPENIIMKDGKIMAIVDWAMSGWYPEYWEFAKAFYYCDWMDDWAIICWELQGRIMPSGRMIEVFEVVLGSVSRGLSKAM